MTKLTLFSILVIFAASVLLSLPLLKHGLYTMHDDQQMARLFLYDQSLKSGQFPPRWVDSLGFGFGYPLFFFYPPLVYATGEIFHLVGFGIIDSVKIVIFLSIFLSGVTMYLLVKEFFGRNAALISAAFYMFVPYRALDIYVRGALAESFSFVWLPLILLYLYKLHRKISLKYITLSAISLALLMITHNLIFLPFIFFVVPYCLFLIFLSSKKGRIFLSFSASGILALCLSAFFWVPALYLKKFTLVDQLLLVNLANYNIHFVYPQQLWNWQWGFGGSAAGLADGISFKIGKIHLIVSAFSTLVAGTIFIKNKKSFTPKLTLLFFFMFIFSAFMTTFYSKLIWDVLRPLDYLQFPWRFLTFTSLFTSILAGSFIYYLKLPIFRVAASIILILTLLVNLKLFMPQFYRTSLTDQLATTRHEISWNVSSSSFEYIPKGVPVYKSELGTNTVAISQQDIPDSKYKIEKGGASITFSKSTTSELEMNINAKTNSYILFNIFNFPGWTAQIDNKEVAINDNNRLKLISVDVPQGTHKISLKLTNIPIVAVSNLISIFSAIIVLLMLVKNVRPRVFLRSGTN